MSLVSPNDRCLKWRGLDWLEVVLAVLCGALIAILTFATLVNVVTRIFNIPVLWLPELIIAAFVWGIFLGASVAVRRNEHFCLAGFVRVLPRYWRLGFETLIQLIVAACAFAILYFGYTNYLQGFRNYLETTGTPIAVITAAVPVFGLLSLIFSIERLINIWRVILSPGYRPEDFGHSALLDDQISV